jgi:integrase
LENNSKSRAKSLPIWDYIKDNFDIKSFMQLDFPLKRLKAKMYVYNLDKFIVDILKVIQKAQSQDLKVTSDFICTLSKSYLDTLVISDKEYIPQKERKKYIDVFVYDKDGGQKIRQRLLEDVPKPFSKKEVSILIDNAQGWFRNILALLFMTGMRIGEAIALDWDDIDEYICVSKTISEGNIGNTKTDTIRYVPVFDDLKPFIRNQKLLTGLANKRVFVGLKDAKDLHTHWHKLIKKCDMEHRVLYQARHTFAIHALDSGLFKVSQIANILGHTSVQMLFQKYAKFIKSEIDSVPKNFSTISTNLSTGVA